MLSSITTCPRRRSRGSNLAALVAVAILASTSAAHTPATPEERCQSARAIAAGKYAQCTLTALSKLTVTGGDTYSAAAGKCTTKYAAQWVKLQAKASGSGSTCDNPRFVDNGDGTVTDRLTGLQWEKKDNLDGSVNLADPHDADNVYNWSASGTAADGTVFTNFLATLNSGGCFAGQCDWRLPARDELLTIVSPAYPACTTPPCIDPIFGTTNPNYYSTATSWTTFFFTDPGINVWFWDFYTGHAALDGKTFTNHRIRAVRAAL